MKDWKSTAQGVLMFLATTFTVATAFLAQYVMTAPSSEQAVLAKVSAGLAVGSALAHGYTKLITTNADAEAVAAALTRPALPPTAASLAATPPEPIHSTR